MRPLAVCIHEYLPVTPSKDLTPYGFPEGKSSFPLTWHVSIGVSGQSLFQVFPDIVHDIRSRQGYHQQKQFMHHIRALHVILLGDL